MCCGDALKYDLRVAQVMLGDTGFEEEQRSLFGVWLLSATFKSVVERRVFELRKRVLESFAHGMATKWIQEHLSVSATFVHKTRLYYSLCTDGSLWYHARKNKGALLVVPDDEIFDIVVREHNAIQHQGTNKTWYEVSARYHGIPKRAVDWVVQRCQLCHSHRPGPRPALYQVTSSYDVMERVQMDLIDMRQEPDGKYRWILHIKDHFSRFCMLYPLRRRRGSDVVRRLLEWIAMLGPPGTLQTDNGAEFVNRVIEQVAQQHHIDIRHSQPGRPRSQGLVERANGHVRALLAKWCRRFHTAAWASALPSIALACNVSVHTSTGKTPYEVVFCRKPALRRSVWDASEVPEDDDDTAGLPEAIPAPTDGTRATPLKPRQMDTSVPLPALAGVVCPGASTEPTSPTQHRLEVIDAVRTRQAQQRQALEQRQRRRVYPRGTYASVGVHGIERLPLDDYRLPCIVLGHKRGAGYRLSTEWGVLKKRVAERHVMALTEGMHVPEAALIHAQMRRAAPRVSLKECARRASAARRGVPSVRPKVVWKKQASAASDGLDAPAVNEAGAPLDAGGAVAARETTTA